MKFWTYLILLAFISVCSAAVAANETVLGNKELSSSSILLEQNSFLPVDQVYGVAVEINDSNLIFNWSIKPGYYLYRDRFKFNAVDATTQLKPPIFAAGKNKYDEFFDQELEVYYLNTRVVVPFESIDQQLNLEIESQGCADAGLCYPPYKQWLTIDIANGNVVISNTPSAAAIALQPNSSANQSQNFSLVMILLFALSGGMILNLMPCVFPVLSIKALSFTMNHQTQSQKQSHGLAYTAGVISSFLAIAIVMLTLRAAGEAIGWGFQLQSPVFVIALIYLFFIMGLAFLGYLEIGTSIMSLGQSSEPSDSLSSSFLTGVLATTVASPCTAPFMGPALGFAISQPMYVALLVFAFLGLGMALPFIALTWLPSLSSKLPKPGPWMDTFKQFLAFPLFLTALWLLWVVGRQTSTDVATVVILGIILISMALWLRRLNNSAIGTKSPFTLANGLAIACLVAALSAPVISISEDSKPPLWEVYSADRLSDLRRSNKAVFINLTADWCITCLANERVAFTENFYKTLKDNEVTYLKGDWTNNDPEITKLLNQFQRSGVPLYLMYPSGGGQPEVLPQILRESIVLKAIST
ncbi:MAG: protein-disulfide reductase DsbD family protein [Porticoccaceae bacterium]